MATNRGRSVIADGCARFHPPSPFLGYRTRHSGRSLGPPCRGPGPRSSGASTSRRARARSARSEAASGAGPRRSAIRSRSARPAAWPELEGRQADGRERRVEVAARGMSSKPTTDTSSGTRRPASRKARWHRGRRRRWRRRRRRRSARGQEFRHRRVSARRIEGSLRRRARASAVSPAAVSASRYPSGGLRGRVDERRVGDAGDPPMTQGDEVLDGAPGRPPRCRRRRWSRRGPAASPGGRSGSRPRRGRPGLGVVEARAGDDQPVHALRADEVAVAAVGSGRTSGSTRTR